ncbi:MAG: hypothetical protein NVS1B1_05720 [Candidatus Limnocylindrales bacterium]
MQRTPSSLPRAAKAAGLAALILGLTLSAGSSPAAAHLTGHPAAPIAEDNDETSCDQATEAAVAAAEQNLETAYRTDRRALERLRETAGDHSAAARDLLDKAAGDLKRIFNTAAAATDDANCATVDVTALDATVTAAIAAMDQVVADATVAVAALPADQARPNDDDEEDDD